MKKRRNKKMPVLAVMALVLMIGTSAGTTMAYFTTHVTASGGKKLELGFTDVEIKEIVENWVKTVTLKNTGEHDGYVRVKAFAGDKFQKELVYEDNSGGGWSLGADGYYYWHDILKPGESTGELKIKIDKLDAKESFNVIVVQECIPVPYDENGNPVAWNKVNWDEKADVIVKTQNTEIVEGGNNEDENTGDNKNGGAQGEEGEGEI